MRNENFNTILAAFIGGSYLGASIGSWIGMIIGGAFGVFVAIRTEIE